MSEGIPGTWRVSAYPSGTIVVDDGKERGTQFGVAGINPHVRILYRPYSGDAKRDELVVASERFYLANWIAALLNGQRYDRVGLRRLSETKAVFEGAQEFEITGPMIDTNPPWCQWDTNNSDAAKSARARLMDRVFGIV